MEEAHHTPAKHGGESHYPHLLIMTALSFVAMYALMYAMVDRMENVFNSWNQVFMAGLMTAAMVLIELGVMRSMYKNKKLNAVILGVSVLGLIGFWVFIRQQAAISDQQFLRSMIPHHAGAILMCNEASIRGAEVKKLCQGIVTSQEAEIARMKAMLGARE